MTQVTLFRSIKVDTAAEKATTDQADVCSGCVFRSGPLTHPCHNWDGCKRQQFILESELCSQNSVATLLHAWICEYFIIPYIGHQRVSYISNVTHNEYTLGSSGTDECH